MTTASDVRRWLERFEAAERADREQRRQHGPRPDVQDQGEVMALEWSDVDLHKRQLCVQHSDMTSTWAQDMGNLPFTPAGAPSATTA